MLQREVLCIEHNAWNMLFCMTHCLVGSSLILMSVIHRLERGGVSVLDKIRSPDWDFPGYCKDGLVLFLHTSVRPAIVPFYHDALKAYESNKKLKIAFRIFTAIQDTCRKALGPLMIFSICSIRTSIHKEVESDADSQRVSKLQSLLDHFLEDLTNPGGGFLPAWPVSQNVEKNRELRFIVCMTMYTVARLFPGMKIPPGILPGQMKKLKCAGEDFESDDLLLMSFLDYCQFPKASKIKAESVQQYLDMFKQSRQVSFTSQYIERGIQDAITALSLPKIHLKQLHRGSTASQVIAGLLLGMCSDCTVTATPTESDLNKQILSTCALMMHDEVLCSLINLIVFVCIFSLPLLDVH
jgi:hypothetical protein